MAQHALSAALQHHDEKEVERLLSEGVPPTLGPYDMRLILKENRPDLLALLLKHGLDPNTSMEGVSLLLLVIREARYRRYPLVQRVKPLLELLLEHGANPNEGEPLFVLLRDIDDNDLLHHGGSDLIRLFVEHGADLTLQNKAGQTPLHLLMGNIPSLLDPRTAPLVPFLLAHGADMDLQDNLGRTPLMVLLIAYHSWAMEEGQITMEDGQNILREHEAALLAFLEPLLRHGFNPLLESESTNRTNYYGPPGTLRHIAETLGLRRVAQRLKTYEEDVLRHPAQQALVSRTKKGPSYGITPALAKKITNFLGGRRKTRQAKKGKKAGKKAGKGAGKGRKTRRMRQ